MPRKKTKTRAKRKARVSRKSNFMGIEYDSLTFLIFLIFVLIVSWVLVARFF